MRIIHTFEFCWEDKFYADIPHIDSRFYQITKIFQFDTNELHTLLNSDTRFIFLCDEYSITLFKYNDWLCNNHANEKFIQLISNGFKNNKNICVVHLNKYNAFLELFDEFVKIHSELQQLRSELEITTCKNDLQNYM